MKERPMLFSAPMVRALLNGSKTQTRRVFKLPKGHQWDSLQGGIDAGNIEADRWPCTWHISEFLCLHGSPGDRDWCTGLPPVPGYYCVRGLLDKSIGGDERAVWVNPYQFTWGISDSDDPEAIQLDSSITPDNIQWKRPGDRLWVREAFADLRGTGIEHRPDPSGPLKRYAFAADHPPGSNWDEARKEFGVKWKPSIHMPRAASRISLEITGVRVERLQEISEADAIAEGIETNAAWPGGFFRSYLLNSEQDVRALPPVRSYQSLWESINGPESWAANPWVWVIEFKKIQGDL